MPTGPERLLHHLRTLATASAPDPEADAALLARFARAGDQGAFAALVRRHWRLVWGVCRRVLRDAHEAEDAAQATFLLLAQKAASLRRPQRLTGWLHGTAHRLALNCRKAASRRQLREGRGLRKAPLPPQPDAVAELSARELLAAVDEELLWLPQAYRLPVILCCLEGHTVAAAARRLGWSPGSVQGRLKRGRTRLQARLARRGLTLGGALAAVAVAQAAAPAGRLALLAEAASRAGRAFAVGGGTASAEVAPRAAELAVSALRGAALRRMGAVAVLVALGAGLASMGAGALAHRGPAAAPSQEAARRAGLEPAQEEMGGLIRQLGDAAFATRQAASRQLMTRDDAAPALRRALNSSDPEVSRRAAGILEALGRRENKRALGRLRKLAEAGEVDQAAELFGRLPPRGDEEAGWQVMSELAARLIELGRQEFKDLRKRDRIPPRSEYLPAGDFRRWAEKTHPQVLCTRQLANPQGPTEFVRACAARGEDISVVAHSSFNDLLVSAGAVRGPIMSDCVIFAAGSVGVLDINRSIVVCDGDLTARAGIHECLVIARGEVRSGSTVGDCRMITSASLHLPKTAFLTGTKVKERVPVPLGFVKFFDPTQAGITVAAAEGGVRVQSAEEGKPFARAGMRVGDLVVALGDAPTDSPETFRRRLRTALVEGGEMTLRVHRDGKAMEVRVRCPQ
jgi:RNA polymerase sigma factor (sigma-70 family)